MFRYENHLIHQFLPSPSTVQLLHKLSVRAADGPQRLLRTIRNPVSDHLPPGCPRIGTSFSSGDAVCARTVVPEDGPAALVIGAFAHGAVSSYTPSLYLNGRYHLLSLLNNLVVFNAVESLQ